MASPRQIVQTIWLAILLTSTSAKTIRFYNGGECVGDGAVQCGDAGEGSCCLSGAPFCRMVECADCFSNDIYSFNRASCRGGAYESCRDGADAHCCITAGGGNSCAAQWHTGGGRVVRMASDEKKDVKNETRPEVPEYEGEEECKFMVEPNMMTYKDKNGVQCKIFLPKGTFKTAAEHFEAGNFDELAKFPAWENQQYTPQDDVRR